MYFVIDPFTNQERFKSNAYLGHTARATKGNAAIQIREIRTSGKEKKKYIGAGLMFFYIQSIK